MVNYTILILFLDNVEKDKKMYLIGNAYWKLNLLNPTNMFIKKEIYLCLVNHYMIKLKSTIRKLRN